MRRKERYEHILAWFREHVPVAETELHYDNPFQLLVAVILSAQCTDKRVNQVTPALFRAFPTPRALAEATPEAVFAYIRSVSYPNNKARHLVGMAARLLSDFGGQVPDRMDDLLKLPGVGRKTANVIQSVAFHKAAMAVDTHVFRVSHRLGLVPAHPARAIHLPGTRPPVRGVRATPLLPVFLPQERRRCRQAVYMINRNLILRTRMTQMTRIYHL